MTALYLGNLNYSSWSIRAALVARESGLAVPEQILPLGFVETRERLIAETGHHTVPVLMSEGAIIRDSLAITETLAERSEPGSIWPADAEKRALARSLAAEMHSGFFSLREKMPVDIRSRKAMPGLDDSLKSDIRRVFQLWHDFRQRFAGDGPFLLGPWSAADAFFAPVVTRFRTYGVELDGVSKTYADAVWQHPALKRLRHEAENEPWEIEVGPTGPIRAWLRD